jgi:hypothetical protein
VREEERGRGEINGRRALNRMSVVEDADLDGPVGRAGLAMRRALEEFGRKR